MLESDAEAQIETALGVLIKPRVIHTVFHIVVVTLKNFSVNFTEESVSKLESKKRFQN